MSEHPTEPIPTPSWRCFFCDEVFTSRRAAAEHFGVTEDATTACRIKGSEHGLVHALREAERQAAEAWFALHNETSDVHKAMYAMTDRHNRALVNAEEVGYNRGVSDHRNQVEAELEVAQTADRERNLAIAHRDSTQTALRNLRRAVEEYPLYGLTKSRSLDTAMAEATIVLGRGY